LLCHGHGVRAVREHGGVGARVGLTDNSDICVPVTETASRYRRVARGTQSEISTCSIRFITDVTPGLSRTLRRDAPKVAPDDFKLIASPTDFLGLNLYTATTSERTPTGNRGTQANRKKKKKKKKKKKNKELKIIFHYIFFHSPRR